MGSKQQTSLVQWVIPFILIVLGIIAENNPLHLIFNIQFTFTAVFYLIVLRLFGYRKALGTVVMINLATYFIDLVNVTRFIFTLLEISFVAVLLRWKGKSILRWDLLFWFIGWPVVCYFIFYDQFDGFELSLLVLFHGLVNALICALFAEVFSDFIPRLSFLNRLFIKKRPLYFGRIITFIILISTVLPMFFFSVYNGSFIEDNMVEQLKNDMAMTSKRVEEKINGMEQKEIQNLKLGSIVQKAHLKEMFDNITSQSDLQIYVVNNKNEIFVYSGTDETLNGEFTLFDHGYVAEVENELSIWLPKRQNNLIDWSNGYYFTTMSSSNLHIFSIVPIKGLLLSYSKVFTNYFQAILLLFLMAVGFAFICKQILTKSLSSLTNMTADLPGRMEQEEVLKGRKSVIYEFHLLNQNFETVANILKQMFQEARMRNNLLTEKTKQLVESKKQLEYLAHYDELTGLSNRRTFQEDIEQILLHSKKNNGEFAVIFIDIDKFKQINDSLGHAAGDQLLKICAQRLQTFVHQANKMKAYRLGGDEFILLIKNIDLQQTKRLCTKLMDEMGESINLFGKSYSISLSIGVSIFPKDGDNVETMISNADSAMYTVKKSGRNGIEFYNGEVDIQ